MIKYLQLEQSFDVERMKGDIAQLEKRWWKEHYNKNHYDGGWSILPLRSIQGSMENAVSLHSSAMTGEQEYRDTALLHQCAYLKEVLQYFECEKMSIRLMKLNAGSLIKEHRDHELSFEEGEVRFHLPVITHTQVEFLLDGERVVMDEGTCWYLNLSLMHSVRNAGTLDRVHLVIDCKVNDWVRALFSGETRVRKDIPAEKPRVYSRDEQVQMIAHLRSMNTPTSMELAQKMENELLGMICYNHDV